MVKLFSICMTCTMRFHSSACNSSLHARNLIKYACIFSLSPITHQDILSSPRSSCSVPVNQCVYARSHVFPLILTSAANRQRLGYPLCGVASGPAVRHFHLSATFRHYGATLHTLILSVYVDVRADVDRHVWVGGVGVCGGVGVGPMTTSSFLWRS